MIELWPAIDLINNQSVRLTEGKYDSEEQMQRSPEEAIAYYTQFKMVKRIHIVDLIGAKTQQPVEASFIKTLLSQSKLPVEIGGGIRSKETIDYYLSNGASYVILGTRALQDLDWLKKMTEEYPEKIYLGLDAHKEQVAVNGWLEKGTQTIFDIVEATKDFKLGGIIYTDISKDGKMQGPNYELTKKLVDLSPHPITASGGIRSFSDMKKLESAGVHAAIVGKAANTTEFWEEIQ